MHRDRYEGMHFVKDNSMARALYVSALAMIVCAHVLDLSTISRLSIPNTVISAAKYLAVVIFVLRDIVYIWNRRSKIYDVIRQLLPGLILLILSVVTYFTSGEKALVIIAVVIISSYGCNTKDIWATALIATTASLVTVVALSLAGCIDFNIVAGSMGEDGSRTFRLPFGFLHPNSLGAVLISIFILNCIVRRGKLRIAEYPAWILIAILMLLIVKTRTSALIVLLGLLLTIIYRLEVISNRQRYAGVTLLTALGAILGIALVFFYAAFQNELQSLDSLLSNRLSYTLDFLQSYPITLLGQEVIQVSTVEAFKEGVQPLVLDNAYYHLLVCQGLLTFISVIVLYIKCYADAFKHGDMGVLIAICLLAVVSISETIPITPLGCLPLCGLYAQHNDNVK